MRKRPALPRGEHETAGAAETESIGAQVAGALCAGDVVLVSGALGAGKTTFVRGACRALGVRGPVTSPTFTIGRRYPAPVPVAHVDLYRLGGLGDEDPALLEDYLSADAIAFVEWPERAAGHGLGRVAARVRLEHLGGDRRRLEVEP